MKHRTKRKILELISTTRVTADVAARWMVAVLCLLTLATGCSSASSHTCDLENGYDCSSQGVRSFCDGKILECVVPPREGACNLVSPCNDGLYCTDERQDGVCVECLDNGQCESGFVCDSSNICVEDLCSSNEDCSDDSQPICAPDGVCVQCTESTQCPSTARICDLASLECRGCIAHEECSSGACNIADAVCVEEKDVLYVATDGAPNDDCTRGAPCSTVAKAIANLEGTRNVIVVAEGTYTEPTIQFSSKTFQLIGSGKVVLRPPVLAPIARGFQLNGNSDVEVFGVEFGSGIRCRGGVLRLTNVVVRVAALEASLGCHLQASSSKVLDGVVVDGSSAVLKGMEITSNHDFIEIVDGVGVYVTNGELDLSESYIVSAARNGITVNGSDFRIVNNFIVNNGSFTTSFSNTGVRIMNTKENTQQFSHNTLYGNKTGDSVSSGGSGMICMDAGLVARNNIIVSDDPQAVDIVQGDCSFEYSLIQSKEVVAGEGNLNSSPKFINPNDIPEQVNYRLQVTSPCVDAAATSDVLFDIDGTPRPLGPKPDMGAHEAG